MRPLRILHVMARYWPAHGGAEGYLHEISRRLVAEGHQVTVATTDAAEVDTFWNPAGQRLLDREAEHDGVRIRRYPIRHIPGSPLSYSLWRYHGLRLTARLPLPFSFLCRLARFTPWSPALHQALAASSEPFDIVAGAGILYETFVEAAQRLAARRGIPLVVYPFTHLGAGRRPGEDKVSRYYTMRHQVGLARRAAALVAMTETEKDFYVRHGLAAERVCVTGAGVNAAEVLGGDGARFRAHHPGHDFIIAFVGALTMDKGAFHLVEAVRELAAAGRPVSLFMIGAPTQLFENALQDLPDEVRQRVVVLGRVDDATKKDLLAACDVLAMPSRTDSFGIVFLEAWLYRKPVIAARAWGMPDVIADEQDGLLVPFGNTPKLAEAIDRLRADPAQRASLGGRGEQKVMQQHTWDHVYAKVSEVYFRLAEQPTTAAKN